MGIGLGPLHGDQCRPAPLTAYADTLNEAHDRWITAPQMPIEA